MRLDVPKFSSEDPQQWVFCIQEYFDYHQTPKRQRLQIVGLCLEGVASKWYQWIKRNQLIFGWHDFLEKLQQQIGASHFEDHLAVLAKLVQIGTVAEFQATFEKNYE